MTTEAATKILEDKQKHLVQKTIELTEERNKIAFGAHVEGDAKARKRLDQINLELATMASEQSSVEAALVEANNRVASAQRDEAAKADRANAEKIRGLCARFVELGTELDEALWDIGTSITEMATLLDEMHALGQSAPTSEQFRVNGTLAIKSMLQELPQLWTRDFDFQRLAPSQKKQFKTLCVGWSEMIQRNTAARLGETKQTEAA